MYLILIFNILDILQNKKTTAVIFNVIIKIVLNIIIKIKIP